MITSLSIFPIGTAHQEGIIYGYDVINGFLYFNCRKIYDDSFECLVPVVRIFHAYANHVTFNLKAVFFMG